MGVSPPLCFSYRSPYLRLTGHWALDRPSFSLLSTVAPPGQLQPQTFLGFPGTSQHPFSLSTP